MTAQQPAEIAAPGAADFASWRRHLDGRTQSIAATVLLVAAFALLAGLPDDLPYTAAYVASPEYVLGAVGFGLVLGVAVLVWVTPAAGVWCAALLLLALGAGSDSRPLLLTSLGGAVALAALGVVAAAERIRQRVAAGMWATGPDVVPGAVPAARDVALRWRWRWLLAGALALAGAVVGIVWYAHAQASDERFRAAAQVATGTVVALDDPDADEYGALVEVGGRRLHVPLPSIEVTRGEELEVRYDGTGRAEATADVDDPTVSLALGCAALLAGAAILAREGARRRRLTTLLTRGGAPVRMDASAHGTTVIRLAPCDAPGDPVVIAADLLPLSEEPEDPEAELRDRLAELDHLDADVDDLSDTELLELAKARDRVEAEAEAAASRTPSPLRSLRPGVVVVVGLEHDDAPFAIQQADGRWFLAAAPRPSGGLRVPWRHRLAEPSSARRGGSARLRASRPEATGTDPLSSAGGAPEDLSSDGHGGASAASRSLGERAGAVTRRLAQATSSTGPWVALPVIAVVMAWFAGEGWDWRFLGLAAGCAAWLQAWAALGRASLTITPAALVLRGAVLDERVPWAQVTDVVADDEALVVRIAPGDGTEADAALLTPRRDLLAGVRDPVRARELLLAARRDAAVRTVARAGLRRRPAVPAVVAMLGAVCALGGALFGLR